ncbi:hypothetical protein [Brevibacillus sp. AY1]|uniref:hypothetical protein n=1 Tax=Brevibacillus sp. AY1 TaxID=2807621 RepID=UPI002453C47F|nr:hypothetical protein [Brevibacillus sp. AY1]MDH4619248.1 hypothetical protein [Brevibacillus sp. AY1]
MLLPNLPTKTLGGSFFWDTLDRKNGWQLQKNLITEHYRILDPENVRKRQIPPTCFWKPESVTMNPSSFRKGWIHYGRNPTANMGKTNRVLSGKWANDENLVCQAGAAHPAVKILAVQSSKTTDLGTIRFHVSPCDRYRPDIGA